MSDPHARRSDPLSSHTTVQSLAKAGTMKEKILDAARTLDPPFNDTQLWERVELRTGKRWQRNIVAKFRSDMEKEGIFERVGMSDHHGRQLVDFVLTTPSQPWVEPTLF